MSALKHKKKPQLAAIQVQTQVQQQQVQQQQVQQQQVQQQQVQQAQDVHDELSEEITQNKFLDNLEEIVPETLLVLDHEIQYDIPKEQAKLVLQSSKNLAKTKMENTNRKRESFGKSKQLFNQKNIRLRKIDEKVAERATWGDKEYFKYTQEILKENSIDSTEFKNSKIFNDLSGNAQPSTNNDAENILDLFTSIQDLKEEDMNDEKFGEIIAKLDNIELFNQMDKTISHTFQGMMDLVEKVSNELIREFLKEKLNEQGVVDNQSKLEFAANVLSDNVDSVENDYISKFYATTKSVQKLSEESKLNNNDKPIEIQIFDRIELRDTFLKDGRGYKEVIKKAEASDEWRLAEYADDIKAEIDEMYKKGSDHDFALQVQRYQQTVVKNERLINNIFDKEKTKPELLVPEIREKYFKTLKKSMGNDMFIQDFREGVHEINIRETLQKAYDAEEGFEKSKKIEKFQNVIEKMNVKIASITEGPRFSLDDISKYFYSSMFYNKVMSVEENDKAMTEFVEETAKHIHFNLKSVKEELNDVPRSMRDKAEKLFLDKYWESVGNASMGGVHMAIVSFLIFECEDLKQWNNDVKKRIEQETINKDYHQVARFQFSTQDNNVDWDIDALKKDIVNGELLIQEAMTNANITQLEAFAYLRKAFAYSMESNNGVYDQESIRADLVLAVNRFQGGEKDVIEENNSENYVLKLIENSGLCKNPATENMLEGFEKDAVQALDKVLKDGRVDDLKFVDLNGDLIKSVNDMKNASISQVEAFLEAISENVAKYKEVWKNIPKDDHEIKKTMINYLFANDINVNEFQPKFNDLTNRAENWKAEKKEQTITMILSNEKIFDTNKPENMVYQNKNMAERRKEYFAELIKRRVIKLRAVLGLDKLAVLTQEQTDEREKAIKNMDEIIQHIRPLPDPYNLDADVNDAAKQENMQRFGIINFEAFAEIVTKLYSGPDVLTLTDKQKKSKEIYERRIKIIKEMKGNDKNAKDNAMALLIPYILNIPNAYERIVADNDNDFEEFLKSQLEPAADMLQIIEKNYGLDSFLGKQLIEKRGNDIAANLINKEDVKDELFKTCQNIMYSVEDEKLREKIFAASTKDEVLLPFTEQIYENLFNQAMNGTNITAIYLNSQLKTFKTNINKSRERLSKFVGTDEFITYSDEYSHTDVEKFKKSFMAAFEFNNKSDFFKGLEDNIKDVVKDYYTNIYAPMRIEEINYAVAPELTLIRNEIAETKSESKEAADGNIKQHETYRRYTTEGISPMQLKAEGENAKAKVCDAKSQTKVEKHIKKRYKKKFKVENIPPEVLQCMVEASFLKSKEITSDTVYTKLKPVQDLIGEGSTDFDLNKEERSECLQYYNLFGVKYNDPEETKGEIARILNEINSKKELINKYEILQKANNNAIIALNCSDTLNMLRYAMYTNKLSDFEKMAEKEMQILKNSTAIIDIADRLYAENEAAREVALEEQKRQAEAGEIVVAQEVLMKFDLKNMGGLSLQAELLNYYYKEIASDNILDLDTITTKIEELFNDDFKIQCIINEYSSKLGGDSVSINMKDTATFITSNREGFRNLFREKATRAQLNKFNQLSRKEQSLFCAVLSSPSLLMENGLPGMEMTQGGMIEKRKSTYAQQGLISNFMEDEGNESEINYSQVLASLFDFDKKEVNKDIFNKAMSVTSGLSMVYVKNLPVDFEKLANSEKETRKLAEFDFKKSKIEPVSGENSKESFYATLSAQIKTDKKNKLGERLDDILNSKNAEKLQMLAIILQDRTLVDYTTKKIKSSEIVPYVNQDKREDILDNYLLNKSEFTNTLLKTADYQKALDTLMSYQIRDDVILSDQLQAGDIAKKALKRKTAIDYKMLKQALDFADKLELEGVQLEATKQAINRIEFSGNKKAIEQYNNKKDADITAETLEDFFRAQALEDGKDMLYIGFQNLDTKQKQLFIKALSQRNLLDISQKGISYNRLGMKDRDFVDPNGRNQFMDDYIKKGGVTLDKSDYKVALMSSLSTQVSDALNLNAYKNEKLSAKNAGKVARKTAVDWKLFQRALQIVNRTNGEQNMKDQDEELYTSMGDLSQYGQFKSDYGNMRENIHNSGSRSSRFFLRKVRDSKIRRLKKISLVNRFLPPEKRNKLNNSPLFHNERDTEWKNSDYGITMKSLDISLKAFGLAGTVNEKVGSVVSQKLKYASEITGKAIGGAGKLIEAGQKVSDLVQSSYEKAKLTKTNKRANEAEEGDKEAVKEASRNSTAEQKKLAKEGMKRHSRSTKVGVSYGHTKVDEKLIDAVCGILGAGAGVFLPAQAEIIAGIAQEIGEYTKFIKSYVTDKKAIYDFFDIDQTFEKYDQVLKDDNDKAKNLNKELKLKHTRANKLSTFCTIQGYENITEMSSYVGLSVAQSLLFSASEQNPLLASRIRALGVLHAVGADSMIGRLDSDAAAEVYGKILNSDYR